MHDARDGGAAEQEHEAVAEAEVVVDGGQKHRGERRCKGEPCRRRQHVDAPLYEADRRSLGGADPEKPAVGPFEP
ncbi:hypothetical protein RZS08_27035, partial [Arthrospira platensis SPKY1]|nr:hypothetical protein [Arthrospira platensis SPKY1]